MIKSLDDTLNAVESSKFRCQYFKIVNRLKTITLFNENELWCMMMVYYKLVLCKGSKSRKIDKLVLLNVLRLYFGLSDPLLINRIIAYFCGDSRDLEPSGWVKMFSIFYANDKELKMTYCFKVYDLEGLGYLTRDIVTIITEKYFNCEDEDEQHELVMDMIELIFGKFDLDKDGTITFEEYKMVVRKEPLLMEFLGKCLPSMTQKHLTAHVVDLLEFVKQHKE